MTAPCPFCAGDVETTPVVDYLTICPHCLRTLRILSMRIDAVQVMAGAVADDTRSLSALQLGKLRQARKSAREANV